MRHTSQTGETESCSKIDAARKDQLLRAAAAGADTRARVTTTISSAVPSSTAVNVHAYAQFQKPAVLGSPGTVREVDNERDYPCSNDVVVHQQVVTLHKHAVYDVARRGD